MAATPRRRRAWAAPAARGPVRARLELPGSKSITNRALMIAALAGGPTQIIRPLRARDTELMAGAVAALGAVASPRRRRGLDSVTPGWRDAPATVHVGNAGTVLRFVPPAAALARADVAFRGDARAAQRPVGPLLTALAQLGAEISDDGRGAVPFTVRGRGRMPGGSVTLDASASSQLVSGLLLAAARYDKGAEIRHEGPPVPSAPHIAMTVAMLRAAGADVEAPGPGAGAAAGHPFRLSGGFSRAPVAGPDRGRARPVQRRRRSWPRRWYRRRGHHRRLAGRSLQAAGPILDVLTAMGATVHARARRAAGGGYRHRHGLTADLRDISELMPVLVALAALADGPSDVHRHRAHAERTRATGWRCWPLRSARSAAT